MPDKKQKNLSVSSNQIKSTRNALPKLQRVTLDKINNKGHKEDKKYNELTSKIHTLIHDKEKLKKAVGNSKKDMRQSKNRYKAMAHKLSHTHGQYVEILDKLNHKKQEETEKYDELNSKIHDLVHEKDKVQSAAYHRKVELQQAKSQYKSIAQKLSHTHGQYVELLDKAKRGQSKASSMSDVIDSYSNSASSYKSKMQLYDLALSDASSEVDISNRFSKDINSSLNIVTSRADKMKASLSNLDSVNQRLAPYKSKYTNCQKNCQDLKDSLSASKSSLNSQVSQYSSIQSAFVSHKSVAQSYSDWASQNLASYSDICSSYSEQNSKLSARADSQVQQINFDSNHISELQDSFDNEQDICNSYQNIASSAQSTTSGLKNDFTNLSSKSTTLLSAIDSISNSAMTNSQLASQSIRSYSIQHQSDKKIINNINQRFVEETQSKISNSQSVAQLKIAKNSLSCSYEVRISKLQDEITAQKRAKEQLQDKCQHLRYKLTQRYQTQQKIKRIEKRVGDLANKHYRHMKQLKDGLAKMKTGISKLKDMKAKYEDNYQQYESLSRWQIRLQHHIDQFNKNSKLLSQQANNMSDNKYLTPSLKKRLHELAKKNGKDENQMSIDLINQLQKQNADKLNTYINDYNGAIKYYESRYSKPVTQKQLVGMSTQLTQMRQKYAKQAKSIQSVNHEYNTVIHEYEAQAKSLQNGINVTHVKGSHKPVEHQDTVQVQTQSHAVQIIYPDGHIEYLM